MKTLQTFSVQRKLSLLTLACSACLGGGLSAEPFTQDFTPNQSITAQSEWSWIGTEYLFGHGPASSAYAQFSESSLAAASPTAIPNSPSRNIIGEGAPVNVNEQTPNITSSTKVVGAKEWTTQDPPKSNFTINSSQVAVSGVTLDEIIGGFHTRVLPANEKEVLLVLGTADTTVNNTEADYIIGGSKASNANLVVFESGTLKTTLHEGTLVKKAFIGGNYIKATGHPGGGPASSSSSSDSITNIIDSGIFNGKFIGGSYAENYGNNDKPLTVSDNKISTVISNGDFTNVETIYGGSVADGKDSSASAGYVELVLTGGNLNFYNAKGDSVRKSIYAGSAALNGGNAQTEQTKLVIDGSSKNFVGNKNANDALAGSGNQMVYLNAFGGGLNSTVTASSSVLIRNVFAGFIDTKNGVKKSQLYAGSNIKSQGNYRDGDTQIEVHDSILLADVLGAGFIYETDNTQFESGNAVSIVKNSALDGWTSGTNRYSGRVFGAGRMEATTKSTMLVASSNVLVSNVAGKDIENLDGTVTHNPGSQVFGAMQSYGNKNSLSYVGFTNVRIEGENTSLAEAFGGGIISGTVKRDQNSTLAVGNSFIEVGGGNIDGFLVGGNNSNWFGSSVIGKLDDSGTFELNGHHFSEGSSTAVLKNGGNAESLLVIGGSLTDYSYYTTEQGKRESYVLGTSSAIISGGEAYVAVGGGYSTFYMEKPITGEINDDAPVSNVQGETRVVISGGKISETVIGGGFAETSNAEMASKALVDGDTYVLVAGGSIKDVVGGGLASGPTAVADVSGDSNIVIAGGSISGNIYAGGVVQNGTEAASAKVQGNAKVTFRSDIGFKGHIDGSNVENTSTLAFGDEENRFNGKFAGSFSEFNELSVSAGSKVELDELNIKDAGKQGVLKLTGKGEVYSDSLGLTDGSRLEVLKGTLVASSAELRGGMLYLDPNWDEAPSLVAIENPSEINSKIVVGQNSALTLGSQDPQMALTAIERGGHSLSSNDIKAAAYIAKPVTVTNSLLIDGTAENNAATIRPENGVVVKKNSALIIDGSNDKPMVNGQRAMTFKTEAGSTVLVNNAQTGKNIHLAAGFGGMSIDEGTVIKASNRVIDLKKISLDENGEFVVATEANLNPISNVLIPNTVLAVAEGKKGLGADRVNEILNSLNNLSDQEAEKALNSIALMGVGSGAQTAALTTSDFIQDSLNLHGSTLAAYSHQPSGADLWIDVNGMFSKANRYKAGTETFGYKSDLGGVTLGGDYSFENGYTLGLAGSFGKGSVRGQGAASGIKNDISYYGLNLYGVVPAQYANFVGTLDFLQTKNEIKQNGYKGKPDVTSFSLSLLAEKPLALNEAVTVTPHVGVRYTHLKLNSFNAGGMTYKADNVNLVSVPIGAALNANLSTQGGVKVKPFMDVTVAPTFGDRKVKNKVGLQETGTLDSFDVRIANNAMFRGKLGIEASKGKHALGVNYGVGAGNMGRVDQTVQVKYRFQF